MFFLSPYIKKVKAGWRGRWGLFKSGACLILWPSMWAPSVVGGHLLESELQ